MGLQPYCIWGLCDSWEYCCGDNVCCNRDGFNPYLVTATILGTIVLMVLCGVYFYSYKRVFSPLKKYFKFSYKLMSTQQENKMGSSTSKDSLMKECVVQIKETAVL